MTPTQEKRLALTLGSIALIGALWYFSRLYTSDAARECLALYHQATTAADSARVDTTVVPASRKLSEPRTCVSFRGGARWQ